MIADLVSRLRTLESLRLVGGAAAFAAAAEKNPGTVPAAFVLRLSDAATDGGDGQLLRQVEETTVGIVLVVRNVGDLAGEGATGDLETVRPAVRDLLTGWEPPGREAMEFQGGSLLRFRDGYLWWQDTYRSRAWIEALRRS